MYSIGEFSRVSGLPIKTLRFYHEKDLLVPAAVDPDTGYRFYGEGNVVTARVIVQLRAMEFPLDTIGKILADHRDEGDLIEYLEEHKTVLRKKIAHQRDIVRSIEAIVENELEARRMVQEAKYEIEEKELEPVIAAGVRIRGKYAECGVGFSRIGRKLGRHICGKPLCLYYDDEYREDDADFEACMPLRRLVKADGIDVRELAGGRCVALVHRGPYDGIGRTYARLLDYAKERGYKVVLPTREVYLKGPGMIFKGNPQRYLTEIQLPIEGSTPRCQAG